MEQGRRPRAYFFLSLLIAGFFLPRSGRADTVAVPEFDLYWTHSNMFRSRFAGNLTWADKNSEFTNSSFEYDLDVGLMSFFRRYVFKDPNFEKSKRLTFRVGYAQFYDLTDDGRDLDEKRALGEITIRFPLGNAWLLTDRNRGEVRYFENEDLKRYRNRLKLERNIAIGGFKMTPYANAEAFFEGKTDRWNEADVTVGTEFPWIHQTVLEFYFTWQFKEFFPDGQVLGVIVQKHL